MSGRESGWEGVDFTGFRIYPNFRCRERGGRRRRRRDFAPRIPEISRKAPTRAPTGSGQVRGRVAKPRRGSGRRRGTQRGKFLIISRSCGTRGLLTLRSQRTERDFRCENVGMLESMKVRMWSRIRGTRLRVQRTQIPDAGWGSDAK